MEQTKEETCEATQELEKVEKQLEKKPECKTLRQKAKALREKVRAKSKAAGADFRKFAFKGNIIDLAIAVIIGTAFGKIVSSLVANIIMPAIGMLIGNIDFSELAIGQITYGVFIQAVFEFFLIALSIYLIFKLVMVFRNMAEKRRKAKELPPLPPALTKTEELLTDIKDLLTERKEKEKGA